MPRISAKLEIQQISDIISIESDDTFKRPIYAGSCIATVKSNDSVKVITVRSTAFDPVTQNNSVLKLRLYNGNFYQLELVSLYLKNCKPKAIDQN